MPTLSSLLHNHDGTAIILPPSATGKSNNVEITFQQFSAAVDDFRKQLDALGVLVLQDTVSMSLINSYEFVVAFIAVGMHR